MRDSFFACFGTKKKSEKEIRLIKLYLEQRETYSYLEGWGLIEMLTPLIEPYF